MGQFKDRPDFVKTASVGGVGSLGNADALYIGGAGDLEVILKGGESFVTFKNIPKGTILPLVVSEIGNNTTATNIIKLGGEPTTIIEEQNTVQRVAWSGGVNSDITHYDYLHTQLDTNKTLKIIYVLPVQNLDNHGFGNGIDEIKQLMDASYFGDNYLFIQPRFTTVPWYANHPTDTTIQQEDNMVELFSIINSTYSQFATQESYLLGYSKSGWGAMNLALRYPNDIDGVLIWDAPLGLDSFVTGDMADVFDNVTYLQNNYDLNDILATNNSNLENKVIIIGGYQLWQTLSETFTNSLPSYPSITYTVDGTLTYAHSWNDAWIKDLFNLTTI